MFSNSHDGSILTTDEFKSQAITSLGAGKRCSLAHLSIYCVWCCIDVNNINIIHNSKCHNWIGNNEFGCPFPSINIIYLPTNLQNWAVKINFLIANSQNSRKFNTVVSKVAMSWFYDTSVSLPLSVSLFFCVYTYPCMWMCLCRPKDSLLCDS